MLNEASREEAWAEDVIFRAQRILADAGILTRAQFTDSVFSDVRTCRVSLWRTELGASVRGIDDRRCMARAYARLMALMQNGLLARRLAQPQNYQPANGYVPPDAREMSVRDIIVQHDPFSMRFMRMMGATSDAEGEACMARSLSSLSAEFNAEAAPVVPYMNLRTGTTVWLPYALVDRYYGSSGVSAGTSLAEALAGAFSDVLERFVHKRLLEGEKLRHRVPRDVLEACGVWEVIERMEGDGARAVRVYDVSAATSVPVCVAMVCDKSDGSFGLGIGLHRNLRRAALRALSQATRCWDMEGGTRRCVFGSSDVALSYHNPTNVMKSGVGVYPVSMISDGEDEVFEPWSRWEQMGDGAFVRHMTDIMLDLGCSPLVRDSSHCGFSSCRVVVPGMSEMFLIDPMSQRADSSSIRNALAFGHFPKLTDEEEERFLRVTRFMGGSLDQGDISHLVMRPLSSEGFSVRRISAFLALRRGFYRESFRQFVYLSQQATDEADKVYLRCMGECARLLSSGVAAQDVAEVLERTFDADVAKRVINETRDVPGAMRRAFPQLHCFDCEHCEVAGTGCANPQEVKVFRRIREAIKASKVDQQELLDLLQRWGFTT